jgi:hypothetical protein
MNLETTLHTPITSAPARSITRHLPTAARLLSGLTFAVCGLNGFLNFLPMPSEAPPDAALAFGNALAQTGYMFPLIKGTELLAGALLLCNRLLPLALVLLAPVMLNIVAFHVFLAPSGLGLCVVLAAILGYLAWTQRASYRPLFVLRPERR